MRLLHVDSSILGANSVSRKLSAEVVEAERQLVPALEVTYRDLAANPLQHITGAHLAAAQPGATNLPTALENDLVQGQAALAEFLAADIVVIGAPMYNFSIPSQLKAWLDRLAVAGKTFKYGEKGPEGLCGGKKVIVASSRKGVYSGNSPYASFDHQEKYLTIFFQFLGVTNVTFIRAEGMATADQGSKAIESARTAIANLV
jgi:FMN-dependent NADH-azoreductase